MLLKGEPALRTLEREIIAEKTEAFESALTSFVPISLAKVLIHPYVKDFQKKLMKQNQILLQTSKKIFQNPDLNQEIIEKAADQYYYNNPFHALVMLYIPRIIVPLHIQKLLKQLEGRTKKYFRRRVKDFVAFLRRIEESEIPSCAPERQFMQYIFPNEAFFTDYLRDQYEYELKILKLLKKGANWRNFSTLDILNSFSISFIPLYRLFSRIWKRISEQMEEYVKTKVLDYYLIDSLSSHVYNILKEKSYRFLLEETFPVDPEFFKQQIHDPEFIMRFNPEKGLKVERIEPEDGSPPFERYTSVTSLLLLKFTIAWDTHYRFEGPIEEWWVDNSKYVKAMTGFCIYEPTPEGYCHYYSITVNVEPSEIIAGFGDMVITTLERMTKDNTKIMMKNIKKYYLENGPN